MGQYRDFWKYVDRSGSCWIWKAGTNGKGYGQVRIPKTGVRKLATHVAWFSKYKYWPEYLCHTCDNSLCVRPSHLYEGNDKKNSQDHVNRTKKIAGPVQLKLWL